MGEQRSTHNEFNGVAHAPVVQAGDVNNIVINPPPQGLPQEEMETYRRLLARAEAQARAEDEAARASEHAAAAKAQARAVRRSKVLRHKRAFFWLHLACWGADAAWVLLKRDQVIEVGAAINWAFICLAATLLTLIGYIRARYELRYGHRIPWSSMVR